MTEITKIDSMYELSKTYTDALAMVDEDGVLTDEAIELLHSSKLDIIQKTENIFGVLRNMDQKIKNMTDEKNYINSKQQILKKNVEKLRELIQLGLDTVGVEIDKKGKKSQKIKTDKGSCFYKFSENIKYIDEEIEDKYKIKKQNLKLKLSLEEILEKYPELIEIEEIETFDYELLKFDYDRDEVKPKGIIIEEVKTLTIKN